MFNHPHCVKQRVTPEIKPRHPKGKKKPNSGKRHEVQPVDLLEEEPLVPVTLEEFFPMDFFKKVTVNMASYSELEVEEDEEDAQEYAQKTSSSDIDGRVLTVLGALPKRMSWKENF